MLFEISINTLVWAVYCARSSLVISPLINQQQQHLIVMLSPIYFKKADSVTQHYNVWPQAESVFRITIICCKFSHLHATFTGIYTPTDIPQENAINFRSAILWLGIWCTTQRELFSLGAVDINTQRDHSSATIIYKICRSYTYVQNLPVGTRN